jgi:hypothetical protein
MDEEQPAPLPTVRPVDDRPETRLLLLDRLETIEARLAKLDAPKQDAKANEPWWRKGTFVVLLGGLATVGIPIATAIGNAISGILESQRMMLTLEHEIVKEHLNAVLGQPIGAEAHLRRVRFLEQLGASDSESSSPRGLFSSGLTTHLGKWAKNEHQIFSGFLDREAIEVQSRLLSSAELLEGAPRRASQENWWNEERPPQGA